MTNAQLFLLIIPILIVEIGLLILALRDLLRPDRQVRGGNKLVWGIVILFISLIGPLLYFAFGREDR